MGSDAANTPPPTAPRPRRRLKFWLVVSGVVLLVLPLAVFLALVVYVRIGMLNSTITNELSSLFGVHAQVGSVSTHWLENLNIDNVKVDATGSGQPLTVDGVHVDWDFGPLLASGRIRSLRIDHPALDLKHFADGRWNFAVKTSESNEPSTQIEQIVLQNGDLAYGNETSQFIHVKDVYASFTNTGRPAPRAFSVRGKLESGAPLNLTGLLGPGENLSANLNGGVDLEKDIPTLKDLTGKFNYELSARRDASGDSKEPQPITFSGRIELEKIQSSVAPGMDLQLANRTLQLQTAMVLAPDGASMVLTGSKGTLDKLGGFSVGSFHCGPDACSVEDGAATLDLAALKALFKLPPDVDAFGVLGTVRVSGVSATLPAKGEPRAAGDVTLADVRCQVPGIGELPPLAAQAHLDWPALSSATLALGGVFRAAFNIRDLRPDPWGHNEAPWASVAAETTVQDLQLDIGQFMQSDAGRRLFFGSSKNNRPIPPELPVAFDGLLCVKNVRPVLSHGVEGHNGVTIPGLQLRDFALHRWPLSLPVPAIVMSGDVTVALGSDKNFGPVNLTGTIKETLSKQQPAASGLSGEFAISFGPDEKGNWQAQPLRVTTLTIPWAALNRIVNVTAMFGVDVDGKITVSQAVYDMTTGDLSAHVELDAPALNFPLPEQLQPMVVNALRSAHYDKSAALLERVSIPAAKITTVGAGLDIKIVGGQLTVSGVTRGGTFKVRPPFESLPDIPLCTFPDLEFTYLQALEPGEKGSNYALKLSWLKTNSLNLGVFRGVDEVWKAQGTFQSPLTGGKSLAFAGVFEPLKSQLGPISLSVDALDAAALNAIAGMIAAPRKGVPDPASGEIQNVKFELQPFPLRGPPTSKNMSARITGKFNGFGAKINPTDHVELTGPLVCVLNFNGGILSLNTLVTLEKYAAVLGGGRFAIPPPPAGRNGSLKFAGKFSHLPDDKSVQFQIENCDLNLGGLVLASADGALVSDGVEPLSELRLDHFRTTVPDLKDAALTYIPANADALGPRLKTLALAGSATFSGGYLWTHAGREQLLATLNLRHADAVLTAPPPLTIHDANGDIPLLLRSGKWPDADKTELRGTLDAKRFEVGATKLDDKKFDFVATPNALKLSEPLSVELPGGALNVENVTPEVLMKLLGE